MDHHSRPKVFDIPGRRRDRVRYIEGNVFNFHLQG
jgi:hypothetical protein